MLTIKSEYTCHVPTMQKRRKNYVNGPNLYLSPHALILGVDVEKRRRNGPSTVQNMLLSFEIFRYIYVNIMIVYCVHTNVNTFLCSNKFYL